MNRGGPLTEGCVLLGPLHQQQACRRFLDLGIDGGEQSFKKHRKFQPRLDEEARLRDIVARTNGAGAPITKM